MKAGAAHVAFSAASRTAVREFYANALQAGGRPHGSPAAREGEDECFNAAILDLDGNSVEVVFREGAAVVDDGASESGKSRLLTWRSGTAANLSDRRSMAGGSVVSAATSLAKKALAPAASTVPRSNKAPSEAPSAAPSSVSKATSKARSAVPALQRSFTAPVLTPQSSNDNITMSRKTLVGTILGAAAGAAVAYAMCKSEEDGAKAEHAAYLAAKGAAKHIQTAQQNLLDAKSSYTAQPAPPQRTLQNASEMEYVHGYQPVRAIEAPPSNYGQSRSAYVPASEYAPASEYEPVYQHPSFTTVVSGQHTKVESTTSKSRASSHRTHSYPESQARSSIISSFVPEQTTRELPSFNIVEYDSDPAKSHHSSHHSTPQSDHKSSYHSSPQSAHSSTSKAKSSASTSKHSTASKRSSKERTRSRSRSATRSSQSALGRIPESDGEPPSKPSSRTSRTPKARSSVLGRSVAPDYPSSSEKETTEDDDLDTIVPSDSVSQIGSPARRPHRRDSTHSRKGDESRRASEVDMLTVEPKKKHKKKKGGSRASEAGTESTMTPEKFVGREGAGGSGSVMSLPVRGITPSMIGSGHHARSAVSYYG